MKPSLRQHYKAIRLAVPDKESKDAAIAQYLLPLLDGLVAGYFPLRGEVDWRGHIAAPHALPCMEADKPYLTFRAWDGNERHLQGQPPQPPVANLALLPDTILVPLIAYDSAGYRLGYGGGWYDKTLAHLRPQKSPRVIGLAYAAQQHTHLLPHDSFDEKMTCIVTENGVYTPA